MFEVTNTSNSKKNKFHFVLICDETGILDALKIIRERLGDRGKIFLSLIYSVPKNYLNPLLEREITNLEKKFSNRYTHTLKVESGRYDLIQKL